MKEYVKSLVATELNYCFSNTVLVSYFSSLLCFEDTVIEIQSHCFAEKIAVHQGIERFAFHEWFADSFCKTLRRTLYSQEQVLPSVHLW